MTTSLLLPFDSGIADYGSSKKTFEAHNGAIVSSIKSKFGGGSLDLTAENSYISAPPSQPYFFTNTTASKDSVVIAALKDKQTGNYAFKDVKDQFSIGGESKFEIRPILVY